MSGLPWYRCFPRDFNEGMIGLTLEERGAYTTIVNLIYSRGGPVPDEAGYFRALLCCSAKTWTKVRAALIVKRKLFEVNYNGDPCLMNRRAADEIATSEKKSEKFSESGRRGGQNSRTRANENNDVAEARLEPGLSDTDTDTDTEKDTPAASARASDVDWKSRLEEAKRTAGDGVDLTSGAVHHYADLRQLCEPQVGEPCTWDEVLAAIGAEAAKAILKRRPIRSWTWVKEPAIRLRDRRLQGLPDVSAVEPRGQGPPQSWSERANEAQAIAVQRILGTGQ